MIRCRYADVHPFAWGALVRFPDGAEVPAEAQPNDPHYRVASHRCGYQDDVVAYAVEHEVAHLIVCEFLFDRPSPVLRGLATGNPLSAEEAALEEMGSQALQRFVRASERPLVGGVDWNAMRARFLEVLADG